MSAKINKWQRHCLFTLFDKLFGKTVEIMSFARSPLRHLSASIIKVNSKQEVERVGTSLHQLVCHKAKEIAQEFEHILFCFSDAL